MSDRQVPLGVTAVMLPELDFRQQIALCVEIGITHYCLRPRVIPRSERGKPFSNWGNHKFDLTPDRLLDEAKQIRDQLDDAGLVPYATLPQVHTDGDNDEFKRHFDGAATVGVQCVRVSPKPYPEGIFDYPTMLNEVVMQFGRILGMARPYGLKIVIETHNRGLACSPALAWNICRHYEPSEIGVILDLPNFAIEGEITPALGVSVLAPYIDHCHIGGCRRVDRGRSENGLRRIERDMCPLSDSDLPVADWLRMLVEADLHVPLIIEDFTPGLAGSQRLRDTATKLRRLLEVRNPG